VICETVIAAGEPMATDKVHFPHMFFLPESRHAEEAWQPRADVYRMPDGWLVKLELAGVCPEDIRLAARGSMLVVQGSRRDEKRCEGVWFHLLEIAYCRFERVLELPGLTERAEIATSYEHGMLLVRIKTGGGS